MFAHVAGKCLQIHLNVCVFTQVTFCREHLICDTVQVTMDSIGKIGQAISYQENDPRELRKKIVRLTF